MLETQRPSPFSGMGPVLHGEWCSFRVWAPLASSVALDGTFNGWAGGNVALAPEGNGMWSVALRGVRHGDQFKYLINGNAWRNDPEARELTNSTGNSVVRDTSPGPNEGGYATPPWNEAVIYELHPGTFNDSPGGGPGNFNSVIARMDYLRDLHINVIELMPSMEFAGDYSWGYNPAAPFAVESVYGGPEGLKKLVREAHARGMAVLIDVVFNHFGPGDAVMWQFDGWSPNGSGGVYYYNDWRSWTPWGASTRPDYGRAEVRDYLRRNALMWLDEYLIDGLRFDMTGFIHNVYGEKHNPGANIDDGWRLMQEINDAIRHYQPWKITIAEDMWNNASITREPIAGGAGFRSQWDDLFVDTVRASMAAGSDHDRNIAGLKEAMYHRFAADALTRVIYTESHDEVANGKQRLPEAIWPGQAASWHSRKRSTLGAVLVMTAPGIPMIFQGQEMLEDEWFRDQDPLDWSKGERFAGIVDLYRGLIALRRNWFDQTRGLRGQHINVFHANSSPPVIGFHRWDTGGPRDDVIVIANVSANAVANYVVGAPRPGLWRVRFNSDWTGYSPDFGGTLTIDSWAEPEPYDQMPCRLTLNVGPYSAVILSQDE